MSPPACITKFSVMWPWTVTSSWPPKVIVSFSCPVDHRFFRLQNIVFTRLVTNKRKDRRTAR